MSSIQQYRKHQGNKTQLIQEDDTWASLLETSDRSYKTKYKPYLFRFSKRILEQLPLKKNENEERKWGFGTSGPPSGACLTLKVSSTVRNNQQLTYRYYHFSFSLHRRQSKDCRPRKTAGAAKRFWKNITKLIPSPA